MDTVMSLALLKHLDGLWLWKYFFHKIPAISTPGSAWGVGDVVSNLSGENATSETGRTFPAQTPSLYTDIKSA